jgi:hypothetical protein
MSLHIFWLLGTQPVKEKDNEIWVFIASILVNIDVDVNKHGRLSNFTLKVKKVCIYFLIIFYLILIGFCSS